MYRCSNIMGLSSSDGSSDKCSTFGGGFAVVVLLSRRAAMSCKSPMLWSSGQAMSPDTTSCKTVVLQWSMMASSQDTRKKATISLQAIDMTFRTSPVDSSPLSRCRLKTRSTGRTRNLTSSSALCTKMPAKQKWNSSKTTGQNSCKPLSALCNLKSCVDTHLNSMDSTSAGASPKRSAPPCLVKSPNINSTSKNRGASSSSTSSRPISTLNWAISSNSTSSSQYRIKKLRVQKVHWSSMTCAGIKW
mmetsp:Transcript_55615/g.180453  ORF Transcript_55615/g.180453 Transcript_55615/m.180453 type:complete len:246 (-) Transcript_55615:334-1071(-)